MANGKDKDLNPDTVEVLSYGYSYGEDEQIVDLSKKTKVKIAQYMSDLTHGKLPIGTRQQHNHPNRFPVPGTNGELNETYDTDPVTGLPIRLVPSTNPGAYVSAAASATEAVKFVGQLFTKTEDYLRQQGKKIWLGGDRSAGLDGNQLLHGNFDPASDTLDVADAAKTGNVNRIEAKAFVRGYTSSVLAKNRFTHINIPLDKTNPPDVIPQTTRNKLANMTQVTKPFAARTYSAAQLGAVGQDLLVAAAGGPIDEDATQEINPAKFRDNRFGEKIEKAELNVLTILESISEDTDALKNTTYSTKSYGTINTPHNTFENNPTSKSIALRMSAGAKLIDAAKKLNDEQKKLLQESWDNSNTYSDVKALSFDDDTIAEYARLGFNFIFNTDIGELSSYAGGSAQPMFEDQAQKKFPLTLQIVNTLSSDRWAQQQIQLRNLEKALSKPEKIYSLVRSFVTMGIAYAKTKNGEYETYLKTFSPAFSDRHTTDTPTATKQPLRSLASSPASLLLPAIMPNSGTINAASSTPSKYLETEITPKIPNINDATFNDLRNKLDKDYVPFYFHDLRTNEIVGFHAYLKTMSDDYTAQYEQHDYMGRGEPIYSYKGSTVRTIGLSFSAFATNETDFVALWHKINKLVTMVYPQYSPGKTINYSGETFELPFSQVLSHSPMIRLRVGDLIRSNYTDDAIAGVFGVDRGNSSPKDKQGKDKFARFTDPDSNSIVRAFRQTGVGGKKDPVGGLAGYLGSLKFTWLDPKIPWETNSLPGSGVDPAAATTKLWVAPKACDITLDFKPVHDITPGLDHRGRNRAPVYPMRIK